MQSSRAAVKGSARFGDPNPVAYGGLKPVVRLAVWDRTAPVWHR